MKEEPRYLQDQYRKQADNELYDQSREKVREDRQINEKNLGLQRRTAKGGTVGRRQDGVEVLSGNAMAVFSDTRADGTRAKSRPSGVPGVIESASKEGAPIGPGEDLPWEAHPGGPSLGQPGV